MAGEVAAPRKDRPWLFKPGQSGNPAGRPVMDPRVRETLEAASPKAALRLVELLDDEDPVIRLKAIDIIQNRLYGKPVASVDQKIERTDIGAMHLRALQDLMAKSKAREALNGEASIDVTPATPEPEIVEAVEIIDPETGEIVDDEPGEDD